MTSFDHIRPAPSGPPKRGAQDYGLSAAPVQASEDDNGEVDIRSIIAPLWRGKWIIAICALFAWIAGALATTQQAPVYIASGKVMFNIERANIQAGEAVVRSGFEDRGELQNQVEVLGSTSLIKRVIEELNLDQNVEINPSLRSPVETWTDKITLPPELDDLMVAVGLRNLPAPPPNPDAVAQNTERLVIANVLRGLRLRPIEGSQVIEIGYASRDPDLSAAIVNAVAQQYIVDQLEGKLETFQSATIWLTDRVSELQKRVETAEAAILAAKASLTEQAGSSLEAIRSQLVALNTARVEARSVVSQLDAQYTRLRDAMTSGAEVGALSEVRSSAVIASLRASEAELVKRDDELSTTLRPTHPTRVRVANDLSEVRADIQSEVQRILEGLRVDLVAARELEGRLGKETRDLEEQELRLSTDSVEIQNLEREAQASRILYENLLSRLQETNAQEDLQTADARILTPAEPPLFPIETAKNRTLAIAMVVGLSFGISLVFLLERLNNTFRSPLQLEKLLAQPVLATIPTVGSRMKRSEVIAVLRKKPSSALAESIRNLRTSILFSNVDEPPKVVMFTSSVPREGKSTTSMLMALTSQQMGKSAIIVDCDLRLPALAKLLEVDDGKPGLLSVINDSASVQDAVHVEPETGLHVLMTRPSERTAKINAADVLASARFRHLIEELSRTYDLVVLDAPPTLVVADARILSALADSVIFAVRWDATPREAVKEGLSELHSVNARITGVVLTMVNEDRASKYAYDGYRHYKGKYRDYYEV